MNYYSTNGQSPIANFREATICGLAPDGGLYFPASVPSIDGSLIDNIERLSNEDISFRVIRPYVGDCIPDDVLEQIVRETISFPIPLRKIDDRISTLELFHGPTLAFKDVGARFMSRCLGHFLKEEERAVTVLVATSGDTGGAVASGFFNVPGISVVILYPSGKVSPVQEQQLTALGHNIRAIEVAGSFDDCQLMVKHAFSDKELARQIYLTSANSINIARWLPQQFYYFLAWKQWKRKDRPPVISVPSGNFGNICAGMLAMRSGLPVSHFIAACNANDVLSAYFRNGKLEPKKAIATISNAMDVGDPSNFVRILEIFQQQPSALAAQLSASSITDDETLRTIARVWQEDDYLLDPHGAVGYLALDRYLDDHPAEKGLFLETAHPVKFPQPVHEATGEVVDIPESIASIMSMTKQSIPMLPGYNFLKDYLLRTT